jgi:hypothetical protein
MNKGLRRCSQPGVESLAPGVWPAPSVTEVSAVLLQSVVEACAGSMAVEVLGH